jgi:hypothetical protein
MFFTKRQVIVLSAFFALLVIVVCAGLRAEPGNTLLAFHWGPVNVWQDYFTESDDYNGRVDTVTVGGPVRMVCRWQNGAEISRRNLDGAYVVWATMHKDDEVILETGEYLCYFPGRHPERLREMDDSDPEIIVR